MIKYKITSNGVFDTESGTYIPNCDTNEHWVEYLNWVALGNTADPEFTNPELETQRITKIKEQAGNTIVAAIPEWKQRNNIARMLELVAKATDLSALTADELAEIAAAQADWDSIKAVRTTSDTAETNGDNPDDIVWPI